MAENGKRMAHTGGRLDRWKIRLNVEAADRYDSNPLRTAFCRGAHDERCAEMHPHLSDPRILSAYDAGREWQRAEDRSAALVGDLVDIAVSHGRVLRGF